MSQVRRSVTFASLPKEVVLVPSDSPESSKKGYSREDLQGFELAVLVETHRLRRLLASGDLPDEELVSCIGIERYLSEDLFQEITQTRQAHIAAILSIQGAINGEALLLAKIVKFFSGRHNIGHISRGR